jgi:hypothetical protein
VGAAVLTIIADMAGGCGEADAELGFGVRGGIWAAGWGGGEEGKVFADLGRGGSADAHNTALFV